MGFPEIHHKTTEMKKPLLCKVPFIHILQNSVMTLMHRSERD